MKNLFLLFLICLAVLASAGCQIVLGDNYSLGSGQTLTGDLFIGGGSTVLQPDSRVTGSLWVTGGSLRANGSIDGDVVLTGGSIDFGSSAIVRGTVRVSGGGMHIVPGAIIPAVQSFVPHLPAPVQALVDSINWAPIWPLIILVPGVICLAMVLFAGRKAAGLAIPGAMLTMLGLICLFQNTFNQFQTWAYVWALVLPTSIGIGMYVEGRVSGQPALRERGMRIARVGLMIFIILAALFELAINLSGLAAGRIVVAALLVLVGALALVGKMPKETQPAR